MPVHDWSRVKSGIFHHFHHQWISALSDSLNSGLLPPDYYALAEQLAGNLGPDVLTLQSRSGAQASAGSGSSALAIAISPPQVSVIAVADEAEWFAARQKRIAVRHASNDEVVSLLEIVSPGNKQSQPQIERFVDKAHQALLNGIHVQIVDVIAPGRRDPEGIHGLIWDGYQTAPYRAPPGKPYTLASYCASVPPRAYVEPIAAGSKLPEMPLFITEDSYVNVPLEVTYMQAYATVPERWRQVIEGRD